MWLSLNGWYNLTMREVYQTSPWVSTLMQEKVHDVHAKPALCVSTLIQEKVRA